jgi:glycosyltransferase involved in cell wall biosynthesis
LERITKKRILIHSIVFSPDSVSTAYLYNDIALGFKNAGYEVVVLTTTPHYNLIESTLLKQPLKRKLFGLFFVSDYKGIDVIHIPSKKYKSTILRLFSFLYWHFFSLFIALSFKKLDFIISPSPPLTIGFVSILIAKKNRAKFIYNVQEIYPDLLIKNGIIKSKIIIKLLKRLERYVYNNASAIITIDQKFYDQIVGRINNTEKLKIIPNFVDTNLYKPLNEELKLPNPFIKDPKKIRLLYAGNIGFYQDWEPILFAAKKLIDTNIEFWIIGEGVKKEYLTNEVNKNNLTNIKVIPYQDRELMPLINSFADIHFISINKEMEQEGFPSKVYTIMACAKPLIVITGENSPLYDFLKNLNCSILISNDRNEKFTNAILQLANNESKKKELGLNGYSIIQKFYTKEKIVGEYLNLFEKLL